MTADRPNRTASVMRAIAPLAIIAGAAAVLLLFPPEQYSFYPQCPIYRYLHLECPGCGTTRALAALLHGNITEAFRLNPLTTLLAAPAAVYAVFCYRKPIRLSHPPPSVIYATLAATVAFTIVRNLGAL